MPVDFTAPLIALAPTLPVVELPPGSVVIADLHLDGEAPEDAERFEALLASLSKAPVVAILGDLFEYWLGPGQAKMPGSKRFLDALRSFKGQLVFVPGNRDILAGAELEDALGSPILTDGFIGRLPAGERLLFLHGDELCVADVAYLRLRRLLRAKMPRFLARNLPGFVTRTLARRLRSHSSHTVKYKKSESEIGQDSVMAHELARAADCSAIIVGHAHAYRETAFEGGRKWYVLDAFGGERDCLRVTADGTPIFAETSPSFS